MIEMSIELKNDIGVIKISGELDASNSKELRKAFEDYFNSTNKFVLDFSDLIFMDSTGLGTIIKIFKLAEQKHGSLCIANPRNKAARVLNMTQAHKVINIFDDLETAVKSLEVE